MASDIISHLKWDEDSSSWDVQTNEEHSEGVAKLAEEFAGAFGMASWGRALGILHDKGKEKTDFQRYIRIVSGYDAANVGRFNDKTHAYVGALYAYSYYKPFGAILPFVIAGHHRGIQDFSELKETLQKEWPQEVSENAVLPELTFPEKFRTEQVQDLNHIIRMLFSCLVDADYLDTERFMQPSTFALRGGKRSLEELLPLLEEKINSFATTAPDTPVNRIRNEVQQRCCETSTMQPGFYALTVPTGGGKTLSSVLWAMRHAVKYGKKRIIIAIPYTSIIIQTAAVLRSIFNRETDDDNVLEHHSGMESATDKDESIKTTASLATENWDYPIIVTTNVQLFESMYSNRPSKCRKLHNIANSVIILDEVQSLPTQYLQPIVDGLQTYQKLFNTTVLFTTASMPTLQDCKQYRLKGIPYIENIIPAEMQLQQRLRRVDIEFADDKKITCKELAEQLCHHKRVLCIVSTRDKARKLFEELPDEGLTLHLSKNMYSKHIRKCIEQIKAALLADGSTIIRVVSTQLVEAGVDIDFPIVYREEAGLDSILQAAGRCNREGLLKRGTTKVFALEGNLPLGHLTMCNNARMNMLNIDDWQSVSAMEAYYEQLYCRVTNFDEAQIGSSTQHLNFETASNNFHLIDDKNSVSIIIPTEESEKYIKLLKTYGINYFLMRKLQPYMVSINLYSKTVKSLISNGAIMEIAQNCYLLTDSIQYDKKKGLCPNEHWLSDNLIL